MNGRRAPILHQVQELPRFRQLQRAKTGHSKLFPFASASMADSPVTS